MKKENKKFVVEWIDAGKEPQCQSDPKYPNGVDVDVSSGRSPSCKIELVYPAPRIGIYLVRCKFCDMRVACTTAGRIDDPRSVKVACRMKYRD